MTQISTDPFNRESLDGDLGVSYAALVQREFPEISDRIYKLRGLQTEQTLWHEIYTTLKTPRVLDQQPSPIKTKADVGIQSGVKVFFEAKFNSEKTDDAEEITGSVNANGRIFQCDYIVIRALKALIKTSQSKNRALMEAALNVTTSMLQGIVNTTYCTTRNMIEKLDDTKLVGYYENQIKEIVKEVLENGKNEIDRSVATGR